jgi:hypothetical protein
VPRAGSSRRSARYSVMSFGDGRYTTCLLGIVAILALMPSIIGRASTRSCELRERRFAKDRRFRRSDGGSRSSTHQPRGEAHQRVTFAVARPVHTTSCNRSCRRDYATERSPIFAGSSRTSLHPEISVALFRLAKRWVSQSCTRRIT